ncbi:MAG: LD-carboxypeptidase [Nitrospinae bacterium CG11_big_fil_rev_8_21_14_0_20_56_8]|nr:MAG: LD-carboxypeptidase [Nitrospinae bacterium CG11_big_fil_rev_8_21_14_0_20_56_8]
MRPARLQPGDKVGVISPAGVVDRDMLEKGLRVLEKMGLEPVLGRHVLSRHRFVAGTDRERAEDLMGMFADPSIRGIVCARGGYGSNRIIPHLDAKVIRRNPKIFVGASDITFLHLYLNLKCSLVTFHGPMVAGSFGRNPMRQSQRQFARMLFSEGGGQSLQAPKARVLKPGHAKGELAGGCLTLLCRSLGTPFELQPRNKILLIEDVNEPFYRIDGMLWQLKMAGKFEGVRGIVFGEMVNCRPSHKREGKLDDVFKEFFEEYSFPILVNCPIGHGREMWTLPLGETAVLDAESKLLNLMGSGVV